MNVKKIAFIKSKSLSELNNLFLFFKENNINWVEKSLYSTSIEEIKKILSKFKFERIYFGVEFCEKKIPTVEELKKVVKLCQQNIIEFSLVTPYVTDYGIKRIKKLIEFLKVNKKNCEVIVNDWGVFQLINENNSDFKIALGRILTKQKKDPRILMIKDKYIRNYFAKTIVENKIFYEFLKESNIKRVELDNTLQNINDYKNGLALSLYYPYVYLTTSKNCFISSCDKCSKCGFILNNKLLGRELMLKGKTQFYVNSDFKNLLNKKFSRLVYQSQIPY